MIMLELDGQLAAAGVDVGAAGRPALVQSGVDTDDLPDRPLRRVGAGPFGEPHPQACRGGAARGRCCRRYEGGLRPRSQIDVGCRRLTPWIGSANSCGRPQCLDSVRSSGWMCTPGRWSGMRIDESTGEVWQQLLPTDPPGIWGWLESLPQPVKVTYEAGPTGYGLARFLRGRGIACRVAAPSKLIRPAGNRVKTDAKDAEHLCRLLRLDEIVEVIVPDADQEAARDLVRAREDVRGDLMRARHRASKLLLRQRHRLSRQQNLDRNTSAVAAAATLRRPGPAAGLRGRGGSGAVDHRPAGPAGRRDRGHGRRQQLHPAGASAVLPARHLHLDRIRVGGGDRGLAPVQRLLDRRLLGTGAHRGLFGRIQVPRFDHQGRQRPCPPAAGGGRLAPP